MNRQQLTTIVMISTMVAAACLVYFAIVLPVRPQTPPSHSVTNICSFAIKPETKPQFLTLHQNITNSLLAFPGVLDVRLSEDAYKPNFFYSITMYQNLATAKNAGKITDPFGQELSNLIVPPMKCTQIVAAQVQDVTQ